MSESKDRHDFINNALRLEILNKLICESLDKKEVPNKEHLQDLEAFLKDHLDLLNKI